MPAHSGGVPTQFTRHERSCKRLQLRPLRRPSVFTDPENRPAAADVADAPPQQVARAPGGTQSHQFIA